MRSRRNGPGPATYSPCEPARFRTAQAWSMSDGRGPSNNLAAKNAAASPGPIYSLRSTMGGLNVQSAVRTSPRFGFGTATRPDAVLMAKRGGASPGPGTYDDTYAALGSSSRSASSSRGRQSPPHKPMDRSLGGTSIGPGPAAYSPTKKSSAPAYSIGGVSGVPESQAKSPGPAMSGTRSYEPWQYAARKGVLLRKNPKRGFLESAYKDKYMCWLSRDTLHLRAAEVVTFRSNQGAATHDKIVVADEEESFPLDVWVLVDDSKDFKDGKFSLKNKDGTTLSLRCEDENATMRAQQAQGWADDLKAILERMTGGPKDGAAGDAPTKGAPEKEPSGSNSAGGPDLGSANAGRGAPKKEDTQPNKPHAPAGTDGRGGGSDKAAQKPQKQVL